MVILVSPCQSLLSDPFDLPYFPPAKDLCDRCFAVRTEYLIFSPVIEMKFETGDEKLKDLEIGVFVGAGRFVVEKGKPVVVEYKLSKAVKGG